MASPTLQLLPNLPHLRSLPETWQKLRIDGKKQKKLNRDGSWVQISSSKDAIVPWIPNYQAMAKTISVSSAMEQVPPAAYLVLLKN